MPDSRLLRSLVLATSLAALVSVAAAQSAAPPQTAEPAKPPITFDLLDGPNAPSFFARLDGNVRWLDDGGHYLQRQRGRVLRVNADTGEAEPAYNWDLVAEQLREQADVPAAAAMQLALRPVDRADDYSHLLIFHEERGFICNTTDGALRPLPKLPSRQLATLSPQARYVSFINEYNLYVADVESGAIQSLTTAGSETLRHGMLDWVYQEEIYGRGNWRAHWWRDDDAYIAYLTLDSSNVPEYTVVDFSELYSEVEQTRYPKPGEPNPAVTLTIVAPDSGERVPVDLSRYADEDILITRVSWAPDGMLLFSVQDREQRWLELVEADPETGASLWLLRETSPAWTDNLPHPVWLADGSFLWLSDREGRRNIFHYTRDARLIRQLTSSPHAVSEILCANLEHDILAFAGSRETPLERHAYRLSLGGGEIEQITEPGFHYRISANPHGTRYLATRSNITTPGAVELLDGAGGVLRVIDEAKIPALDDYAWNPPELLAIPNRAGQPVHATLVRPVDFDPDQKYPVWIEVYGGPGTQTVYNAWPRGFAGDQALANAGILVFRIDPHSSIGGGFAAAQWTCYQQLGVSELADIEAAVDWLIDQGYADPARIGITGASYGGYVVAFALTHSERFKLGLSVMPVTDWRLYDSIYTERFMRTPQNNPDGYVASSAIESAGDLAGRLILVHGVRDENVHVQNTLQFIDALQQAGERFELMLYPRDRHGFFYGGRHWRTFERETILEGL